MSPPVFISYARKTSRLHAERLHQALGGPDGLSFLDTSELGIGERIPQTLMDALLESKVVVVFVDDAYFKSWYCGWELGAALAPVLALTPDAPREARDAALESIVIARPPEGIPFHRLELLPPSVRSTLLPGADDSEGLARLVCERLEKVATRLKERLGSAGLTRAQTYSWLEEAELPPLVSLAGFAPLYPLQRPPSLGASFVGRAEDLWRMHYTLWTRGGDSVGAAFTGSALEGGGGAGKTRLALEYLHRLGPRYYPGGIFWVDADVSDERLEEQLHGILRALRPDEVPDLAEFRKSKRDLRGELQQALHEASRQGPILYVVDNVPEVAPDVLPRPLDTWCPALGKVALLVTSRARSVGMRGLRSIPVGTLARSAAVRLLTEGIGHQGLDEAAWSKVVEWVDALPLALELLNQSLRAGVIKPAELLAKLKGDGTLRELDRQRSVLRRHVAPTHLPGVVEVCRISYERLTQPEQRAARLIAWLAHEPVPLELFQSLVPEEVFAEVRSTLELRHYIRPIEEGAIPLMGSMHRLLADFLRSQAKEPEAELVEACSALLHVMDLDRCRDPRDWPLMNACLPHAEVVFQRMREAAPAGLDHEIELGLRMEDLLHARGLLSHAVRLGRSLVARALAVLGPEHPDTLIAMSNHASTLCDMDELVEAETFQRQVLECCRRIHGDTHPRTLQARSHLAGTLCARGDLEGAHALEESVLQAPRDGASEPFEVMNNLAETLFRQGRIGEAWELWERAYEGALRENGAEHRSTLRALNNLAVAFRYQGQPARARPLHEKALEAQRRLFGDEHPDTLTTMNTFATTLEDLGDINGARELQEKVLEHRRRILGDEHRSTLVTKANLALTYWALEELGRARSLMAEVVSNRRRRFGDEHHETLITMSHLADLCRAQGELSEARDLGELVLRTRRRVLGEAHPDIATSAFNLALTLKEEGELAGARELLLESLEIHCDALGMEHEGTVASALVLCAVHHAVGERASAMTVFTRHLAWLLDRQPEQLPPPLQGLRRLVVQIHESKRLEGTEDS